MPLSHPILTGFLLSRDPHIFLTSATISAVADIYLGRPPVIFGVSSARAILRGIGRGARQEEPKDCRRHSLEMTETRRAEGLFFALARRRRNFFKVSKPSTYIFLIKIRFPDAWCVIISRHDSNDQCRSDKQGGQSTSMSTQMSLSESNMDASNLNAHKHGSLSLAVS